MSDLAELVSDGRRAMIVNAIDGSMNASDRAQFAKDRLGISDIGNCREYARRVIVGEPRDIIQQNWLPAFVGTAVGDKLEDEMVKRNGWLIKQAEVTVNLVIDGHQLSIPGHPDIILEDGIIDFKTMDGLGVARNTGSTLQQKFQLTLYGKALIDAGLFEPEECWLSLAYIDRSGEDNNVVMQTWLYDDTLLYEAEEWLSDVIYAVVNNETASKDKPRDWCWACCDFAPSCRGGDTDVEGLITDELILNAVKVYKESAAIEARAKKDKESAVSVLRDIQGSTGEFNIRWVNVPGSDVAYSRAPYQRLTISPVKSKQAK